MSFDLTPPCILLEDRLNAAPFGLLYACPRAVIRCDDPGLLDEAFRAVEQGLAAGLHAAGLFSYELGYALEPKLATLMPAPSGTPLLWLGLFDAPTHIEGAAMDRMFAGFGPPPPVQLACSEDQARHAAGVREALRLIAAGDIYQVNLTFPIDFRYSGDPLALYAAMRARQPVAHGGFAALGEMTMLSVSPELWISVRDNVATTRPMKGTAERGKDPAEDAAARAALVANPKQRAENLMIVDLLRNDLSRISVLGTVQVPAMFTVESYPSLHTMTSTVMGRLRTGVSLREKIAAMFPCGSVVGAPKIRAGEVIRALEPVPRGFYTGALGAIAPSGDMQFNVAIRTAVLGAEGHGCYGVGGGIVADSDPDAEYEEAMLKARVLTDLAEDYGLIETFRWSASSGFVRLDLHLARMAASARALQFALDERQVTQQLLGRVARWQAAYGDQQTRGDRRVRVLLARDGTVSVSDQDVVTPRGPMRVMLASDRLDPGDPFLGHKTTRRAIYERAFAEAKAMAVDEAVLLNRRGEVAEASRHTVFVEDGRLVTPPLDCGVLPGVLRRSLLECGAATEAVVTPDMLASRPLWLGNSLHGLRRAMLVA
ncbi:aminodeoxychorismate synthase component I [Lichenicoccus sp.]|uniref:aminodeoxychorismate synthase component I n=1 Tax=Lichenicoccus sp. TaxID=2781899 RepID=UPI003D124B39